MTALPLAARALACAGATAFLSAALSFGHGGTYRGPGDTVPSGGGAGGGGSQPGTPGGGQPGMPGGTPTSPGFSPRTPGNPGAPGAAPTQTPGGSEPDLTTWSFWWEFNKEPYLQLKAAVHGLGTTTGSDGFFLGAGDKSGARNTLRPSEEEIRAKVVPALLHALATEKSNDIVTGALIALAKIGDEKDESGASRIEQAILPFLKSNVQEIAETAAVALGILAHDSSVETLAALMRDGEAGRALVGAKEVTLRTRAFAAYGLSLIGARTASAGTRSAIAQHLIEVLESDRSASRDVQVACLIALGLVPLEEGRADPLAADAEARLPHGSRGGQIEYLMAFFADAKAHHYIVRAHVPAALGRLLEGLSPAQHAAYKPRVVELFLAGLAERSKEPAEVVQSCVLALGQVADDDDDALDAAARAALVAAAEDSKDQQARNFALIALAQAGGRRGAGSPAAAQVVPEHLVDTLKDGANSQRPWAAVSLGVFGHALAAQNLPIPADAAKVLRTELAKAKAPETVAAYAIGAGILGDIEAAPVLLEQLAGGDETTRGYVAVALGLLGHHKAVEPIKLIVAESKYRPELLQQAAIGLGLLGDKRLVPDLIDMLLSADSFSTQAAVAAALGSIGDARSIEPLVAMLANEEHSDGARGFAAVALGIVADKEALPWNAKISVGLNYRASTQTLTDQVGMGILNIL